MSLSVSLDHYRTNTSTNDSQSTSHIDEYEVFEEHKWKKIKPKYSMAFMNFGHTEEFSNMADLRDLSP